MTFSEQIKRNSLAVISLLVALTALSYNTWRNEQTEENRNIRQAGFEMLLHISELQRITYLAHFDKDRQAGNPRRGWVEILVLQDLAKLMPASERMRAAALHETWEANWSGLGSRDEAVEAIDAAIEDLRGDIADVLESLD
ncbi:MAG: hypothetical protein ACE5G3_00225 [Gammaproteobacteria bacterium]